MYLTLVLHTSFVMGSKMDGIGKLFQYDSFLQRGQLFKSGVNNQGMDVIQGMMLSTLEKSYDD